MANEGSTVTSTQDDPASPQGAAEVSMTADLATARVLANLGAPGSAEISPLAATQAAQPGKKPLLALDFTRAAAFLDACESSTPRVTYGLGKKVPFLGAVPGRDFTQVDCSGFVREAVRLSAKPPMAFPDGSVTQHDWVQARGFQASTVAAGAQHDGTMRIAFLRPQDVPSGIGHVVLIVGGQTPESHGGRARIRDRGRVPAGKRRRLCMTWRATRRSPRRLRHSWRTSLPPRASQSITRDAIERPLS